MMTEERQPYDAEAARAAIEADRQARIDRCAARFKAALSEERCQIVAQPALSADGRIVAEVRIVAL